MRNEIASLELYFLAKEFEFLVGSKVDKVYYEDNNLLLQLHITSKGKQFLNLIVPNYVFIASRKTEFPKTPGGFTTFLRKYLNNARIKSIRQAGFERILEIVFEGKTGVYNLIIELFSKGNIVLCKEDYRIMSATYQKNWSVRVIRGGVKYEFPKKDNNILDMKKDLFVKSFIESKKESAVKTLALDFSFGGVYAEELCKRAKIDKNKEKPSEKEIESLFDEITKLLKKKPIGVRYGSEAYPFSLEIISEEKQLFDTFNDAIDSIITPKQVMKKSEETKSKHDKKVEKTQDVIKNQEKQITKLKQDFEKNQRVGELIYENYQEVKDVLDQLRKAREKFSWKEIKQRLKGHKVVKEINEKDSKVLIEVK